MVWTVPYLTECPPGYTGMDCAYRCHYPTYGEDCFMTCDCSSDMCDFAYGCIVTSTTGQYSRKNFRIKNSSIWNIYIIEMEVINSLNRPKQINILCDKCADHLYYIDYAKQLRLT